MDGIEDFFEFWAWLPAEGDEVFAGNEGRRDEGFVGEVFGAGLEKGVVVEVAVAPEAIDAVKFHFFGKGGASHEAFEAGDAHVLNVFEDHVVLNHFDRVGEEVVGEAEAAHEGFGHACADRFVAVEAKASGFVAGLGGRFADVVKENRKNKGEGNGFGKEAEHKAGVNVHIAFGVEFGGLLAAFERGDFGEDFVKKAGGIQEVESFDAMGREEDFGEFLADAFGADLVDGRGTSLNG